MCGEELTPPDPPGLLALQWGQNLVISTRGEMPGPGLVPLCVGFCRLKAM